MARRNRKTIFLFLITITMVSVFMLVFLRQPPSSDKAVPHKEKWGIYSLDLDTGEVKLLFSSPKRIEGLRLNNEGNTLVFCQEISDNDDECVTEGNAVNSCTEICTVKVDGSGFQRLTWNDFFDTYPSWSPDDAKIAFLTMRNTTLDIFLMNPDGSNEEELYDSGFHDADIDGVKDKIVFTRNSQIWIINDDGTGPIQVTNPPQSRRMGRRCSALRRLRSQTEPRRLKNHL